MEMIDLQKIIRMMFWLIVVLVVLIISGTIFAFVVKPQKTVINNRKNTAVMVPFEEELFGDLGRLRLSTADTPPVALIVTPVLEYPADNIPAREELVKKKQALRECCRKYFAKQRAEDLVKISETKLKKNLATEFNQILSLHKVKTIYFKEYIILK